MSTIKKTIVFIIPYLHKGGAERISLNLAKVAAIANYNTKVIYYKKSFNLIDIKNLEFIYINSSRLRYSFFKTLLTLKKLKPDYIFSTLSHINIYLLLLKFLNLLKCKIEFET